MLNYLIELDKSLFLFFNSHHTIYLDQIMWVITGKIVWIPIILSFVYIFFKKGWKEGLLVTLMLVLTVAICDQISSGICKPLFERLRPTHDPEFSQYVTTVNGYLGGKFGFISSHAANAFGLAIVSSLIFKNRLYTISIIVWALLSCYSRMYLGVHYPGDILCGALVGVASGYFCYKMYQKLHGKFVDKTPIPYTNDKNINIVLSVLYITYIFILVFSPLINFKIK